MGPDAVVAYTGVQWAIVIGLIVLGLAIKAWILWWLYRDTRARGVRPVGWLVAAAFFDVLTIIVWLVSRPRRAAHGNPTERASVAAAPPTSAIAAPAAAPSEPASQYRVADQMATPATAAGHLRVTCPSCSNTFVVPRATAGPTTVRCDRCGATGRV